MRYLGALAAIGLILAVSGTAEATGPLWGTGSPDWGTGSSGPSPVIFQFDTATGAITTTYSFESSNWMWTAGVADDGNYLYASHNTYDDKYDLKIAKINRNTGAVLSDTSIAGFLGQTYSQVNALDFHEGKLYAVENATSGSTLRGYALEIQLDAGGDVTGAVRGAYVGPYPDCGLDYHDGLWYATSWGYTDESTPKEGSLIYTSPDIMDTNFTQVGTSAVEGIGMIDGWEFDEAATLFAVTWYDDPTTVYDVNPATWVATALYDLAPQLPSDIIQLNGLSEVPEPATIGFLALGGVAALLRRVRRRG
jgi:hypothetical protein